MERPIIFSTPMVQAILAGKKTQTRRIIKPQPTGKYEGIILPHSKKYKEDKKTVRFIDYDKVENNFDDAIQYISCPYGKKDDILWVKETFAIDNSQHIYKALPLLGYWVTKQAYPNNIKWKPSIFMPKNAARIFLRIKGIAVERVREITEKDAGAEGITEPLFIINENNNPLKIFQELWEHINGKENWANNPFVWVIEFERVK